MIIVVQTLFDRFINRNHHIKTSYSNYSISNSNLSFPDFFELLQGTVFFTGNPIGSSWQFEGILRSPNVCGGLTASSTSFYQWRKHPNKNKLGNPVERTVGVSDGKPTNKCIAAYPEKNKGQHFWIIQVFRHFDLQFLNAENWTARTARVGFYLIQHASW